MIKVKIIFLWGGGALRILISEKGAAGQINLRNTVESNRSILLISNLSIHSEGTRQNYFTPASVSHCSCTVKTGGDARHLFICYLGGAVTGHMRSRL